VVQQGLPRSPGHRKLREPVSTTAAFLRDGERDQRQAKRRNRGHGGDRPSSPPIGQQQENRLRGNQERGEVMGEQSQRGGDHPQRQRGPGGGPHRAREVKEGHR